jgi:hypothetical protein
MFKIYEVKQQKSPGVNSKVGKAFFFVKKKEKKRGGGGSYNNASEIFHHTKMTAWVILMVIDKTNFANLNTE